MLKFLAYSYLATGAVAGCYATYLNRGIFRHGSRRHFRMAMHTVIVGLGWPVLAPLAIAVLRKPGD